MPHATLLKYPGTNCDVETARALQLVGFTTAIVPIADATRGDVEKSQLLMFSGGFSYGDYVMSGRLAQLVTESKLGDAIQQHHHRGVQLPHLYIWHCWSVPRAPWHLQRLRHQRACRGWQCGGKALSLWVL